MTKKKSSKSGGKAKAGPVIKRRWVAPNRIEERENQGWARVAGKDSIRRNGAVLMEKGF